MQSAHDTATRAHSRPALRAVGRRRPRAPGDILLRACRPRQWLKNLLVALAPAAAGALTRPGVIAEAACAFASFCLLASATYLVNDVRDREQDQRHPRKRLRPVAAGELAPRGALRLASWSPGSRGSTSPTPGSLSTPGATNRPTTAASRRRCRRSYAPACSRRSTAASGSRTLAAASPCPVTCTPRLRTARRR